MRSNGPWGTSGSNAPCLQRLHCVWSQQNNQFTHACIAFLFALRETLCIYTYIFIQLVPYMILNRRLGPATNSTQQAQGAQDVCGPTGQQTAGAARGPGPAGAARPRGSQGRRVREPSGAGGKETRGANASQRIPCTLAYMRLARDKPNRCWRCGSTAACRLCMCSSTVSPKAQIPQHAASAARTAGVAAHEHVPWTVAMVRLALSPARAGTSGDRAGPCDGPTPPPPPRSCDGASRHGASVPVPLDLRFLGRCNPMATQIIFDPPGVSERVSVRIRARAGEVESELEHAMFQGSKKKHLLGWRPAPMAGGDFARHQRAKMARADRKRHCEGACPRYLFSCARFSPEDHQKSGTKGPPKRGHHRPPSTPGDSPGGRRALVHFAWASLFGGAPLDTGRRLPWDSSQLTGRRMRSRLMGANPPKATHLEGNTELIAAVR